MLSVQQLSAGILAEVIRRQPASAARTTFAWTVAAGPAMARAASVEIRDGVLLVSARDAGWAREIARARDTLLPRVQALLGRDAVTSIDICVTQ